MAAINLSVTDEKTDNTFPFIRDCHFLDAGAINLSVTEEKTENTFPFIRDSSKSVIPLEKISFCVTEVVRTLIQDIDRTIASVSHWSV